MNGFYFEYPIAFTLLLLFFVCERFCKEKRRTFYFPHVKTFAEVTFNRSNTLMILKWLTIVMMVIALASPVKDEQIQTTPDKGYDIALVLDTSESMSARGFNPRNYQESRFDVVKKIVSKFVKTRVHDNIGVVVFGKLWVELGGLSSKKAAQNLLDADVVIPGFRRSNKPVEALLNKYIPSVTILGSVILGLIAGVSDILGVFGSGIGILLTVDILINYYNQLVREKVELVMPRLGAWLGRK